jgi:nucleoside phosphorylase
MKIAVLAAFNKEAAGLIRLTGLPALRPAPSPALRSLKILVDRRARRDRLRWTEGDHADMRLMIGVTGIGVKAAERAGRTVVERFGPDRIVVCGTAGSLAGRVAPLDIIIAGEAAFVGEAEVAADAGLDWIPLDAEMAAALELACAAAAPEARAHRGALVSVSRAVLDEAERGALHARTGAIAVDMEAAAIAGVARRAGIPLAVVKAATDRADSEGESAFRENLARAVDRVTRVVAHYLKEGAAS